MGPAPMRRSRPPRPADEALDESLGPAERTATVIAPPFTAPRSLRGREEPIAGGPIAVGSAGARHPMPVHGHAWIGIRPAADGTITGPSHHGRIVEHVPARLQVREEPVHPSRGASRAPPRRARAVAAAW